MKKLIASLAALSIIALPVLAGAASVRVGENYSLTKGEVITDNLYAAGANLVFAGDMKGDLTAAGGSLTLKGTVAKDAALAGGTIILDGSVGEDARIAGGTVTVSGTIKGDLALAGGDLRLLTGSDIGGDLLIAGGTVMIDGDVAHNVRVTGGDVTINGNIGGSVWNRSGRLTLGATAVVSGDVTNSANQEAVVDPGAVVKGKLTNVLLASDRNTMRGIIAAAGVVGFLIFLFAGLICFWLFKNRSKQFVAHALGHFGTEVLRGLLLLIVLPIFLLLLCLTVVGMPFGFIGLLMYIAVLLLAKIFSGVMLGGWINKVIFKKPDQIFTWQTVIGGNVVLFALRLIPVIGGLIGFIFMIMAFGAFWGYLYRHFWVNR